MNPDIFYGSAGNRQVPLQQFPRARPIGKGEDD